MFERFTEKAIKSIMLAQQEGRRLGHNYVDTEQLMLGLIGEGTGIAAKSLKASGVCLKEARDKVEAKIGKGNDFAMLPWYHRWSIFAIFFGPSREMPFKPRAKKVLELSWDEARELKHNSIGTEHLLLGLIERLEIVLKPRAQMELQRKRYEPWASILLSYREKFLSYSENRTLCYAIQVHSNCARCSIYAVSHDARS